MIRNLLATFAVLLAAGTVHADEIRLKDGRIYFCEVLEETPKRLRVRIGDVAFRKTRETTIRKSDIESRLKDVDSAALMIEAFLTKWKGDDGPEDRADRVALAQRAWKQRLDGWIAPLLKDYATEKEKPIARLIGDRPPHSWIGNRWTESARKSPAGRAARAALDWLATHQDDDGRIDADNFMKHDPGNDKTDGAGGGHHGERQPCGFDGAVTGLAALAWMASGSTPVSGPYRKSIAKAISFCRTVVTHGPGRFDQIWNHGFCTQALAEAYWLGRDSSHRPVLEQAARDLRAMQNEDGGWRYISGAPSGVPSSAVAGMALAMCRRVGIAVPKPTLERATAYFIARVDPKSGRSEYHDGAEHLGYTPTRANTAAALATRGLSGAPRPRNKRLMPQLKALTKHKARWKIEFKHVTTKDGRTVLAQVGYLYPYAWYYTDLALHFHGAGSSWRAGLRKALVGGQRQDGAAKGSWDPKGTYSDSGGRGFVTALGALMLLSDRRYQR